VVNYGDFTLKTILGSRHFLLAVYAAADRVWGMEGEARGLDKRKAKRINVDLKVKIEKSLPSGGSHQDMKWADTASLKNISYLGAYFEYGGFEQLFPGDILGIRLDVQFPLESNRLSVIEQLPLDGFAKVVRTVPDHEAGMFGVGVEFLKPLSFAIFNSL
jgi:PilZ domain